MSLHINFPLHDISVLRFMPSNVVLLPAWFNNDPIIILFLIGHQLSNVQHIMIPM